MDKMILKTKNMQKVLEPVETQLQLLLMQDKIKISDLVSLKSRLLDRMQILINKFDKVDKDVADDYQEIKKEAFKIMDKFCSTAFNNSIEKLDQNSCHSKINTLLGNFITSLKSLEDLECIPLKQALQECLEYIKEMGSVNEIEDFQNIKEFGTVLLDTFGPLQVYRKNLSSQLLSDRIALYSHQLYIIFSMLVQLIEEQHELKAPIYSSKKYICDRMCYCFQMIIKILEVPNPSQSEENFELENHFVYRMDLVLDILSEMIEKTPQEQFKQCEELWFRIEDIFSHAMAIAQVCELFNFNAIMGICQTIMSEYEKLKVQLQVVPPDTMIISLFINTLKDALYRLEHRINVSMLTLVMETFSDPFVSLKKVVKTCGNAIEAQKRSSKDLSEVIEEFDQTTDKTTQIGLFAIACCRNNDRVNRIRSCLASFESLETELIPAVTAFYLHPDNKEMRTSVKLLTEQWQKELTMFHRTIYFIIDSAAYCQVVLDDLQDRTTKMSNCLDNLEGVTQLQVQAVVKRALSLANQISVTIDDVGREIIEDKTIKLNQELKAAIYEANAASKMLLQENAPEAQQLRVIKRCELILNVIKKLQPDLNVIMNTSISIKPSYVKSSIYLPYISFPSNIYELSFDQNTVSYIRTPYTVKSCKTMLSLQPANSIVKTQAEMSSLIPYIKKGRTMRMEHSIMYKTPVNLEHRVNKNTKDLSSVRQHLFSRESFHQNSEISLNVESLDLTGILDKVTNLCDTLDSNLHITNMNENIPTQKEINCEKSVKFVDLSLVGGGDAPAIVEMS